MKPVIRKRLIDLGWISGITFLAGASNISTMIAFGMTVSHYTGNISNAALAISRGDISLFDNYLLIILLFLIGAVISGWLYHDNRSGICLKHSLLPLLLGSMILLVYFTSTDKHLLLALLAFGMGMQNGVYLNKHGVVIRFTHMSGYLTDAGVCIGRMLHGHRHDQTKFYIYVRLICLFFIGGISAAVSYRYFGMTSFALLGGCYILVGGLLVSVFVSEHSNEDGVINWQKTFSVETNQAD